MNQDYTKAREVLSGALGFIPGMFENKEFEDLFVEIILILEAMSFELKKRNHRKIECEDCN